MFSLKKAYGDNIKHRQHNQVKNKNLNTNKEVKIVEKINQTSTKTSNKLPVHQSLNDKNNKNTIKNHKDQIKSGNNVLKTNINKNLVKNPIEK